MELGSFLFFPSPFWNRCGDAHFASSITLDLGELRGPHGDPGKDSRKLAAESWLRWQEAFREWVKVALSSLAHHRGKWTRIWAVGGLVKK